MINLTTKHTSEYIENKITSNHMNTLLIDKKLKPDLLHQRSKKSNIFTIITSLIKNRRSKSNSECRLYHNCCRRYRHFQKIVYLNLEEPGSSIAGKAFFCLIITCIMYSTFHTIIDSDFKDFPNQPTIYETIEFFTSIIFLLEIILRLISCTAFGESFLSYIRKPIMINDFISNIPFFLEIFIDFSDDNELSNNIRMLRLIRMFRIFKITRYLHGAHMFWEGLKANINSFAFLLLCLVTQNLVFATIFYYVEYDKDATDSHVVTSIPDAMWWALVTMTTVGYGDKYPHTNMGRAVAGVAALSGMFIIGLPVATLGISFQTIYDLNQEDKKIVVLKKKLLNDNPNVTEDQKEIAFMNSRMKALSEGSNKIKELLNKSDGIYICVEREIKTLYSAVYAQQKYESPKNEESLAYFTGMNSKIKIMERLQRAKTKIKLMNLFHRSTSHQRLETFTEPQLKPNNIISAELPRPIHGDSIEIAPKDTVTDGFATVQATKTHPVSTNKYLDIEDPFLNSDCDEDILIIKNIAINYSPNPRRTSFELDRQVKDNKEMLAALSRPEKKTKFFIKSNSFDNENSFIKYKIENLDFLNNKMLNELLMCDESDINSDDDSSDSNDIISEEEDNKNSNFNGQSESKIGLMKHKCEEYQIQHDGINVDINNKKESIINPNSKTWKLVEKIYERQLNRNPNKNNSATPRQSKRKVNQYFGWEDYDDEEEEKEQVNKSILPLIKRNELQITKNIFNGPRHTKPMMIIKTSKKIENDDVPFITEESPHHIISTIKVNNMIKQCKIEEKTENKSKFKKLMPKLK